jgi:hypothetical protein
LLPLDRLAPEARLRTFVEQEYAFSETAVSLSVKLGVNSETTRHVLDRYVEMRVVQRRTFERGIEPVYYRYKVLAS